jgi:predicted phage terminase large subunit-like protein
VIAKWGATATDYYLLDIWRARVEFPELKRAIVAQSAKHKPNAIYVEDAASGQSALQEMRRETMLPLIPVKPEGSKEGRAAAVSPLGEAGKVWVPESADWLADWIEEHAAFPVGAHDDQVDCTSMALEQLRGTGQQWGLLEW